MGILVYYALKKFTDHFLWLYPNTELNALYYNIPGAWEVTFGWSTISFHLPSLLMPRCVSREPLETLESSGKRMTIENAELVNLLYWDLVCSCVFVCGHRSTVVLVRLVTLHGRFNACFPSYWLSDQTDVATVE